MNVKHLVTKKLEDTTRRVFFQLHNDSDAPFRGELLVQFRWALGVLYTARLAAPEVAAGQCLNVHVDVPKGARKFSTAEWWWISADAHHTGTLENSGKKEDLVSIFGYTFKI